MLKSLVLSTHVFSQFTTRLFDAKEIGWLWEHSFAVSLCARKIAEIEQLSPMAIDDAMTAGLLHETGKLVLASCLGKDYAMALEMTTQTGISLNEAEQEIFGCSHAQVGAYLLGLWGLADGVVEAVAWHLEPTSAPLASSSTPCFSALAAIHAACAFHAEVSPSRLSSNLTLNRSYIESLGVHGHEADWNIACTEALRQSSKN
jgi:HD-like signal output (HDOD) protein